MSFYLHADYLLSLFMQIQTTSKTTGSEPWKGSKAQDYRNAKNLSELLEENLYYSGHVHVEKQEFICSRLETYKKKSTTFPPFSLNNSVSIFVKEVLKDIQDAHFHQQEFLNLNTYQKTAVKEPLGHRIYDHTRDIKLGALDTPLGRHVTFKHHYKGFQVQLPWSCTFRSGWSW